MDFLAYLRKTGFVDVDSRGETGFNSSPKTRGMLVRARKPGLQNRKTAASLKTDDIHAQPDAEGVSTKMSSKIDILLQRAIKLGAEKIKLIDTDSIVIEKWVKWKCIYGCPMFGKDGHHPPNTPDIDETKEVIGEYSKAILLSGADGRLLTEVACRLEGKAYHMGYYQAFALAALPAGNGSTSGVAST
ncbi:MAG: DUF2284 domain-containing protein [Desulfobacterales bacterium]